MRLIRGTINALLVATLVKPMARWMIGRWRRRARDYADEALGAPAREFLQAALLETALLEPERTVDDVSAEPAIPAPETDDLEAIAGRSALRTMLLLGAMAAAGLAIMYAIVIVRRGRKAAAELEAERVAIPIDVSEEEAEAADSPAEEPAAPTT